ncbi:hypothetical protein NQ176_g1804 [Zarea fungicola]|uniref:Uncharacterized protein n=1 Tax=Zarea fungicola TaxID=93591 RepID=A0ACC1NS88_9HYPO|nr:hypothetical protein NQ176_g1804 [Lecanicillium fungicola]
MAPFQRLIRFLAQDSQIYYGSPIMASHTSDIALAKTAHIITGDIFSSYTITTRVAQIVRLLSPIAPSQIRTVRCLGLNYARHAHEAAMAIPKYPVLFHKPVTSISGPFDSIPVPAAAQEQDDDGQVSLDYECELVIVIGKEAKDVSEADALSHILGYCVGNDVSQRLWQLQRGGGQWSLGKCFDGWGPIGPGLVSPELISDPQTLTISTRVNEVEVQRSNTADMIFDVAKTISFLSRGTTLLPGDVIFTGTPEGVAMGRRPQPWLKHGDVIRVELEGVGSCTNRVEFANDGNARL